MKKMTIDGNEACSKTAYYFTEIAGIYPITPSSTMAEHVDEWSNKGELNLFDDRVKVIEMQSEAGVAGFIHGALQSGLLATTFTASQGLLLMIPNMYKMAGEMLPCVIHVAARSLSTHALSIFGDHQDIYATRQTGFCMLASSSVQDAAYLSGVAHLSAISTHLPFLHFFDGFRTSHEINKINMLEKEDYEKLLDKDALNKFRKRALNLENPKIKGTSENDDIYFQITESRNKDYISAVEIVKDYMDKINSLAGTNYKPFNYYGSESAKYVIVAMGSVNETIKEVIEDSSEYGLVEVHLYRPFSSKYLKNILPNTVEKIAVLDRTKEAGSIGEPLYLDVMASLKDTNIKIVGGRYGLSSKNTTPKEIDAIYEMLKGNLKNNFTIGINDDVTNLSLEPTKLKIKKHDEIIIYGYGSDGMVSASKSIIKMIGDNTEKYVQGYFEYDSKKSGGVTVGHLRFSDEIIKSTYYVENPKMVVLTKDSYLEQFDLLSNIKDNGIFLIITDKTKDELLSLMSQDIVNIIKERNIKVYISNAISLARKIGLGNKISMIVEAQIMKLSNIMDYELVIEKLTEDIIKKFSKKGSDVVNKNIQVVKEATNYLEEITIDTVYKVKDRKHDSIYEKINARKGNDIKVSEVLKYKDGTYESGTSKFDKRKISDIVPNWILENCINCNQCSFVCPHSVIRPYLLNEEEYNKAPKFIKDKCIKMMNPKYSKYYFTIAISVKDCTGCGLCVKTCPGKKMVKALELNNVDLKEQDRFDYLNKNIKEKETDTNNVIGCSFKKPYFEFPGSCAGCGETAYLKILSQIFGKSLVIANATGCSSIYGASMPSMPYNVSWASSLFEDNAEYGFGISISNDVMKNRIANIFKKYDEPLFKEWLENSEDYEITNKVYKNIDYDKYPELKDLKDYIVKRSNWIIGGDGWAYDIGFSGIDHILASNTNTNILVLNTEVYSNTGGQMSKATPIGNVASFASSGKITSSKDLAKIALTYKNVYVAQINLGANMMQVIKALKEAEQYNGPSIVIAYSTCINHGIEGGMTNSLSVSSLATKCGYYPIFRYNPSDDKFILDSKNVDFDLYEQFLNSQNRFNLLKKVNPKEAEELFEKNKKEAIERFDYYKNLEK